MVPLILTAGLPLATAWVEEEQQRILRDGVPLDPQQGFDAHLAGVREPARIRLLKVDQIPLPENPILRQANEKFGLVSALTAGITFGYGIYIREDMWGDRPLVIHEWCTWGNMSATAVSKHSCTTT